MNDGIKFSRFKMSGNFYSIELSKVDSVLWNSTIIQI